jgi:hypothetical protein
VLNNSPRRDAAVAESLLLLALFLSWPKRADHFDFLNFSVDENGTF